MKNLYKIFTLSLLFLYIANCEAQSGWFDLNSGTNENIFSAYFVNDNTGFVTGTNGRVLKTTNAGINWETQFLSPSYQLRYVFFTDVNTGYIVSGGVTTTDGVAFKTTNCGANWNLMALPYYSHLYCITFTNSNTGFITGYNVIYKTTDAGVSWTYQLFSHGYITYTFFTDANIGYAVTFNSKKILKTTNGGSNWQDVYTNTTVAGYFGIWFINESTGMAAGGSTTTTGNALITRTTDGGASWNNTFVNNVDNLWSVRFVNSAIGFIAGRNRAILKTTNAGINWYFQYSPADTHLTGSFFINENTGYVTGWMGQILKTTDGGGIMLGINPESNNITEQFSLSQNYPNPFNPTAKIKFEIRPPLYPLLSKEGKASAGVVLKVYDVLGKEVATLVNENLKPGTYEVEFDGTNYPSGIYYYRLITYGFTETRKMILVK